jgi:fermentation-respiration switch protein FrsA (DUF1100 family)
MKIIALGIALYALLVLLTVLFQRRLIYFPPQGYPLTPRSLGLSYEEIELVAEDGVALQAWFVPLSEKTAPVLLYLHGNAANLSGVVALAPGFMKIGFSFLALDYRGYGESQGAPSEAGLYRDAQAAYRWLAERKISPVRIFVYGQSLGAAVAAWLASQEQIAGLIMEGAFPSTSAMARQHYPWLLAPEIFVLDKFPAERHVQAARCPVLVIHGEDDEISPLSFGERVFAAASPPKYFLKVLEARHNSISPDIPEVRAALLEFKRRSQEQ